MAKRGQKFPPFLISHPIQELAASSTTTGMLLDHARASKPLQDRPHQAVGHATRLCQLPRAELCFLAPSDRRNNHHQMAVVE